MVKCEFCKKELELDIHRNREYCDDICKGKEAYRKKKLKVLG